MIEQSLEGRQIGKPLLLVMAIAVSASFYLGRLSLSGSTRPLSLQYQRHDRAFTRTAVAFYKPANESALYRLATSHNPITDKFTTHTYEQMYSKYFEVDNRRLLNLKILEIGLGCDMNYGPGASAKLWREYFPNAELWFGEYNAACVRQHMENLNALNISTVVGDQGDVATLQHWVTETKGGFDIIIDDGGHTSSQIYNSFKVLFPHALKPGGIYFVEDLQVQRWAKFGGSGTTVMIDVIKDWVESITVPVHRGNLSTLMAGRHRKLASYEPKHKLGKGIVSIDCMPEMCAFIKCTADDNRCPVGQGPDASLPW